MKLLFTITCMTITGNLQHKFMIVKGLYTILINVAKSVFRSQYIFFISISLHITIIPYNSSVYCCVDLWQSTTAQLNHLFNRNFSTFLAQVKGGYAELYMG